ncbi:MAG: hypothetical protein WB798_15765, partial [Nocardioidaceae bacterium]
MTRAAVPPVDPLAAPGTPPPTAPDRLLVGFARALRASGVPVTHDRTRAFLEAVAIVGLGDQRATYWSGQATLCASPEDLARYDQVFTAWFRPADHPHRRPREQRPSARAALDVDDGEGTGGPDEDTLDAMASEAEVLRHRDIADLPAHEKARLAAMFAGLAPRAPRRSASR